MDYPVKIIRKEHLNHDVIQWHFEKPKGYSFTAGQAIEMTLDQPQHKGPSPFTFTGLNSSPYLELTTKIYKERNGLTASLAEKKLGESVIIGDPWDSYAMKGPGVFMAGGAGLTPFVAILRQMKIDKTIGNSHLFFSNKTKQDVFLEDELKSLLGNKYIPILTRDPDQSRNGRLDDTFIKKHVSDFNQPFYICGPPGFMENVQQAVIKCGGKQDMVVVSF